MRTAYFNGQFIAEENVRLHVSDLAIQRGYGIFDFLKTINHQPVFMDDYFNRFFNSAAAMRLDPGVNRQELRSIVFELIARNQIPDAGIKFLLTGGYSADGYLPGKPNFVVTQQAFPARPAQLAEQGMRVITHEHVREFPGVKSINYITGVYLQQKLGETGAADVLYHMKGVISEFPRANFFIVTKDERVVTPSENVLPGITRKKTLEIARRHFKAEERAVTLDDMRNAKEAFVTSTSRQVTGIVQIDDIILGDGKPGEITRFLDQEFQKLVSASIDSVSNKHQSRNDSLVIPNPAAGNYRAKSGVRNDK